jgi:hypothetical protein
VGDGLLEVVVGDVQPEATIVTTSRAAMIPTMYFVFIGITLDEVS